LPRGLPPAPEAYIQTAMTSSSASSLAGAAGARSRDPARDRAMIRAWLYFIALLIIAMVVVGGATRLTHSGLSITEWQPIHGVIPPLSAAEWQEEFQKYQQIPEFKIVNPDMTLAEFKGIFWWEWSHRILGRLIGFALLLPLIYFWATKRIERALVPKLVTIFVLGGIQGAIGWWMVASGLVDRTDVSQYRLATHLTFACLILSYVLWVARGLSPMAEPARRSIRTVARVIVGLVLFQIFLGGLVAGLDAGMGFNTWPLMDGAVIPTGLLAQSPWWRNLFENAMTVQFDHRVVAYVVLAATLFHAWQARGTAAASSAAILFVLVLAQAAIGITTLLMVVPLPLGLLHQFGATIVLSAAVIHLRAMSPDRARVAVPA
jgi:cytochrome c oxidase assembly protein subunit 15